MLCRDLEESSSGERPKYRATCFFIFIRLNINQIEAFKPLKFKLIYLNDKTFGQAGNYKLLKKVYEYIKAYNKDFQGFIIQTTCLQILKQGFIDDLKECHIFACELGIETFNNNLLHALKKPQSEKTIIKAVSLLKQADIKIIANLIIGLIGETKETYNKTLNFIKENEKDIYLLNIYNLAIYLNTELSKEVKTEKEEDLNENSTNKSFYTEEDLKNSVPVLSIVEPAALVSVPVPSSS